MKQKGFAPIYFLLVVIAAILLFFVYKKFSTPNGGFSFGGSCFYNGQNYKNGASVPSPDNCNTCGCSNGQVACTVMACQ